MDLISAERMVHDLMIEHGLISWSFEFKNSTRRLGVCWHGRSLITLAIPYVLLNNRKVIKDTILHEIAHALLPASFHGHGRAWQIKAIEIGAVPVAKMIDPEYKRAGQRNAANGMLSYKEARKLLDASIIDQQQFNEIMIKRYLN